MTWIASVAHSTFGILSLMKTYGVEIKAFVPKGKRRVQGQKLKTRMLRQGVSFVFGCNAAGDKLPPLLGIQSKKHEKGRITLIRLDKFKHLFVGSLSPILCISHKDDKVHLPRIFEEHILPNTHRAFSGSP